MKNKTFWFALGTLVCISPLSMSDTITSEIERSLEICSSELEEEATGWQRIQLAFASRDDRIELCAEQIQSDLRAAADSDYQSGQATDQMFRRQMDELSKYMSTQKAVDIAGIENDDLSVERFVVVNVKEKPEASGESAGDPTIETLPGYVTISK